MTLPNTGDNESDLSRGGEIDYGGLVQHPPAGEPSAPAAAETSAAPASAYEVAPELTVAEAHEFFTSLDKAVRARRLYAANNPAYQAFLGSFRNIVRGLWHASYSFAVTVEETGFRWEEQFFTAGEGRENLAFQFYKDGIRGLTFLPGFEQEIERVSSMSSRARAISMRPAPTTW